MKRELVKELLEVLKESELYNFENEDHFLKEAPIVYLSDIIDSYLDLVDIELRWAQFYSMFAGLPASVKEAYNKEHGESITSAEAYGLSQKKSWLANDYAKLAERLIAIKGKTL